MVESSVRALLIGRVGREGKKENSDCFQSKRRGNVKALVARSSLKASMPGELIFTTLLPEKTDWEFTELD